MTEIIIIIELLILIVINALVYYTLYRILGSLKAIIALITPPELKKSKAPTMSILRPLFKQEAELLKKKLKGKK